LLTSIGHRPCETAAPPPIDTHGLCACRCIFTSSYGPPQYLRSLSTPDLAHSNMASHHPPAILPTDPYTWRESVLSTRTLSYISQADALGSSGQSANSLFNTNSRNSSAAHTFRAPPTRQSTMDDGSEYGLEMAQTRRLEDISELPDSVARSRLFSLPREIRDRIYLFCLTARAGECVEWPNMPQARPLHMAPQLLRTCKLIYAEATSVLYTSNRLSFAHPSDANMFVRAISSPIGTVTFLNLHIKAQDTRLWMPYLTSADKIRSLKADFPCLKELVVRYKSNKWQHALPVESNLRHWADDLRLDELIKGLGHVFYPVATTELPASTPATQEDFQRYLEANSEAFSTEEASFKQRLLQLHRAQQAFASARQPPSPPAIRIICACRISHAHFAALTTDSQDPQHQAHGHPAHANGAQGAAAPPTTAAALLPGMAALQGIFAAAPPPHTQHPVQSGDDFRGFSPVDLRGNVKIVADSSIEGWGAVASVARTVFAKKGKVGLALEIFSVETTGR
jgi:hypothetical protein